jgi:dihydrodipicolinate synthase/N-acetylneuraminate lyase
MEKAEINCRKGLFSMNRWAFREEVRGNFLPVPTPFHDEYSLDIPNLKRQIRRLLNAGYKTGNGFLLIGGAAGEFYTLETEERKRIGETAVEEAAGRIAVIVGAQSTSMLTVLELARFATVNGSIIAGTFPSRN